MKAQKNQKNAADKWRFWLDRGGTFTDVIGVSPRGEIVVRKILSESADGGVAGLVVARELLGLAPGAKIPAARVAEIRMGTTIATNALLERKGDKTALAITAGFRDSPLIGYQQRPKLFDLRARRPPPLHARAIEIEERIDAAGKIARPLSPAAEDAARARFAAARKAGCRALAVAFLHSYKNGAHERRIARAARAAGFSTVVQSREAARLMRFVPRADTAILEAYLRRPLRDFVRKMRREIDAAIPLFLMQSSGALVAAEKMRAKDAVLSGPAGGAVATAAAGAARAVGFDMGGTSTDVCCCDGGFARQIENEIGGARLFAPMIAIHTIAAGGGSLARVVDGRLAVGPQSAGARPGPAAYGGGGPATITDCNVVLGKLRARFFPSIFGTRGDSDLDEKAAATALAKIARALPPAARPDLPALADSFVAVAVENMAAAIRKITVARGRDARRFLLNCFGGAAGQHACRVADALDIDRALAPRRAGALSAWGIGIAKRGALGHQTVEVDLARAGAEAKIRRVAESLVRRLRRESGGGRESPAVAVRAHCRYAGSQSALAVDWAAAVEMRAAFDRAHKRRFGFSQPSKAVVAAFVEVEIEAPQPPPPRAVRNRPAAGVARAVLPVFCGGKRRDCPFYDWREIAAGQIIEGPAVVFDPLHTIMIEPEWRARLAPGGDLRLFRARAKTGRAVSHAKPTPAFLEVFNNRFTAVAEQMGATLQNAAESVNIRERLDFSCALFDARGALVANAPHVPVHLGSMSESVRALARKNPPGLADGHVFMLNSPYAGGTHLPDITVIKPARFDSRRGAPEAFVAARGHHADIGGVAPGSMPAASSTIDEEGVLIDLVKIVGGRGFDEAGVLRILRGGAWPARDPEANLADLKAQIAACEAGISELRRTARDFGAAAARAYLRHVRINVARAAARLTARIAAGEGFAETDDGAAIRVKIRKDEKGRAIFDFRESSPRHPRNFNAPAAVVRAAVLYCLRALLNEDMPLNDGLLAPIRILLTPGSMLSPAPPAAVAAGNVETSQLVVDAVFAALGALAGSQGTCNNFTFGIGGRQFYETVAGGMGAGAGFSGADAAQVHMTNSRLTDVEVLERAYRARVERFSIRKGSGGRGRWRGGDGVIRRIVFLAAGEANILSSRRVKPAPGLCGGAPGRCGENWIERADGRRQKLPGCAAIKVAAGDAIEIRTPGGGGFGAPPRAQKRAKQK